jgi:hypothetical protein
MRELLRRLQRVPTVFIRNPGRSVEQLQDRLACFVELIGARGFFGRANGTTSESYLLSLI